jgi:hypothetical protein
VVASEAAWEVVLVHLEVVKEEVMRLHKANKESSLKVIEESKIHAVREIRFFL